MKKSVYLYFIFLAYVSCDNEVNKMVSKVPNTKDLIREYIAFSDSVESFNSVIPHNICCNIKQNADIIERQIYFCGNPIIDDDFEVPTNLDSLIYKNQEIVLFINDDRVSSTNKDSIKTLIIQKGVFYKDLDDYTADESSLVHDYYCWFYFSCKGNNDISKLIISPYILDEEDKPKLECDNSL